MPRPSEARIEEIREENRLSGGDPMLTDLLAVIDALRIERNFLVGYISGTPGWTDKHPEEVLDWARAEAQKEAPDA